MPDINGIELLKRLQDVNSKLPIIVISGGGDVALAVEAMKGGAVDFLEKPLDDAMLLAAVQSAFNECRQHADVR
jgi:two-component system, LuxR family, response regulator FixJ